ncbi:MAG: GlsB/YeaQ/YmgE family stress response membrane protein [Archangium gephyra]|uniref:GlsB/YeaQ/YmgE family stress response membrane protein n=1 Tax=Archangium gephyra TaxID=48 RepID=A0A2W5V116_9BACT|nr:MAG: GlsB/YeaQ/YmgE family stress response membrane protein [Archangium gephyra]
MGLIAIIVVGLLAGLVARALMPGAQSMNLLATTVLGIAGSFVGGLVNNVIFQNADWFELRPTGLLFSVIGALAVLALMGVGQRVRS